MSGRVLLAGLMAWVSATGVASAAGDPARGADLYQRRCGACHSLGANRTGPMHQGVYGRRSGAVPGAMTEGPCSQRSSVTAVQTTPRRFRAGE